MREQALRAILQGADLVEFRLDFLNSAPKGPDIVGLFAGLAERAIATCRPVREGGRFAGDEAGRLDILRQAAALGCFAIDIEADVPVANWPGGQVIVSHHDFGGNMPDMDAWLSRMAGTPAAVCKVAFQARSGEDWFRAAEAIRKCPKPGIALAMGPAGVASRVLAGRLGAWGTFAALEAGLESAPGQPTLAEMKGLYRWGRLSRSAGLYGVIGCPVGHSMSPAVHNAAFEQAGLDAGFVPLLVEPGWENFRRFMDAVREREWLGWRGFSVTLPHKENALRYVGPERCDELARRIGAINTITIGPGGTLRGDNTDYGAAIDALCRAMGIDREGLAGRAVAVLGAGGAARAVVAGLCHYGSRVTVKNRTVDRAVKLASDFGCAAGGMVDVVDAEIVVNCTPMGMHPNVDACPVAGLGAGVKVVFDTIYNPLQTKLLAMAKSRGCVCVSGLDMFVLQAAAQFELWTGKPAPTGTMRDVVERRLNAL